MEQLLIPLLQPWHSPVPAAAFLSWPWPHHLAIVTWRKAATVQRRPSLLVTCPHALKQLVQSNADGQEIYIKLSPF